MRPKHLSDLRHTVLEALRLNLSAILLCGRMEYHETGFSMFRDIHFCYCKTTGSPFLV